MTSYETILERMEERYRQLTGFAPDAASDIGIRLKVLAEEVSALCDRARELSRQVFPQTSTGEHLDLHAETRGIVRKPARAATGTLLFRRELPAPGDIRVEAGVICTTRPGPQVQFETIQEVVLPAGETQVEASARALTAGTLGNVAPGAVCLMVTNAPGLTAVSNPAAFSGGADQEGDDALRDRLLESYRSISNGTNRAYYYDLAMEREGVVSASVIPRARGRGTVDVVVTCAPDTGEAVLEGLGAELEARREINVDVLVRQAEEVQTDLALGIAVEGDYSFQVVSQACQEAARNFVENLEIGEPLYLARLLGVVLSVDGVYNCRIGAPAEDILPGDDQVVRPGKVEATSMVAP